MRNLKRALSLALASVMLVGMMVVGTSAASFPDVDNEDHVEAIEVLNAVKVMIGDNGDFRPDSVVTRYELAVIIARLMQGPEAAKTYKGSYPFTDVTAGDKTWVDPYLAYCYEQGIVNGVSETEYAGQDEVTALQGAAMMLRALGYEDLPWGAATALKAQEVDLFSDMDTAPTEAKLTRNDVAQLALNTLCTPMVEAQRSDAGRVTGYEKRTSVKTSDKYNAISSDADKDSRVYIELGEYIFNGKLEKVTGSDTDALGHATSVWKYDDEEIVNVSDAADYTIVVDAANKTLKDWADSAKKNMKVTNDTKIIANNCAVANGNDVLFIGDLVEFINVGDTTKDVADKVIVTHYDVGKVTTLSTNKDGDVRYYVTDQYDSNSASGTVYDDPDKDDTVVVEGSVEKDDIVTYTKSTDKKVTYIYPTTTFEGAQESRNNNKGTIVVDGDTYTVIGGVTVNADNFPNSDDNYTFYVDMNGFVVKSDAIEESGEYAVIDAIALTVGSGLNAGDKTLEAVLVYPDGTSETVGISKINDLKVSESHVKTGTVARITTSSSNKLTDIQLGNTKTKNAALQGVIVTYTEDGSKYELTLKNVDLTSGQSIGTGESATNITMTTGSGKVDAGEKITVKGTTAVTVNGTKAGGTKVNANSDTQYIVKTGSDEWKSYTGFREMPNATAGTGNNNTLVSSFTDDSKVKLVYIDLTLTSTANGVLGDEGGEIIFVTGKDYSVVGSNKYYVVEGILDGEETDLEVTSDVASTLVAGRGKLFEVKEKNGDGYISKVNDITGGKYKKVVLSDGANTTDQTIGGYVYNDDTTVYVIDNYELVDDGIEAAESSNTIYVKTKGDSGADAETIDIIYIVKGGEVVLSSSNPKVDVINDGLETGDKKVTLTGTSITLGSKKVIVPKGAVLTINGNATGTIELDDGKLVLGENVTTLPTITGEGTVEIKGQVETTLTDLTGTNGLAKDLSKNVKLTADKDNANAKTATVTLTGNGLGLTGAGALTAFDSKAIDDVVAKHGSDPVSLYVVKLKDLEETDTITAEFVNSDSDATLEGDLSTGVSPTEDGNTAETLIFLAPAGTQIKITVTSDVD